MLCVTVLWEMCGDGGDVVVGVGVWGCCVWVVGVWGWGWVGGGVGWRVGGRQGRKRGHLGISLVCQLGC